MYAYAYPGHPRRPHPICHPRTSPARYDAHQIERGVLMPLIGPEVYLPQSNEEIRRSANAIQTGSFLLQS